MTFYGDPFDAETVAADGAALQEVFTRFFHSVGTDQWQNRTGKRAHDWTMHQTLAHLDAIAGMFNAALDATLRGERFLHSGLGNRSDLGRVNQREIEARQHTAPEMLFHSLLTELAYTIHLAETLTDDQLACEAEMLVYVRPIPLRHLIAAQLSHAGVIHASQIARGVGAPPLWRAYSDDMMHRMLARMLMHASYAYWPTRGGNLRASVQFRAAGSGGGAWHMIVGPEGGCFHKGAAPHPTLRIWTRTPDVMCQMITADLNMPLALLTGRFFASGALWCVPRLTKALASVG